MTFVILRDFELQKQPLRIFGKDVFAISRHLWDLAVDPLLLLTELPARLINDPRIVAPSLVYQPGKVGSVTVVSSLMRATRKHFLRPRTYHVHYLNRLDVIEASIRRNRKSPEASLRDLGKGKKIRRRLDAYPQEKWNIISLVRDPVAIRVSALFHELNEYMPDWQSRNSSNTLSIADLQHLLISGEEFEPKRLDGWFGIELDPLLGFEVLSVPFDISKGYTIYRIGDRFQVLMLRLEDLNRVAAQAFEEFMGFKNFQLKNGNTSDEKPYHELYRQFKSTPLPREFVEAAYSTRLARHFYTEQDIARFVLNWTSPKAM